MFQVQRWINPQEMGQTTNERREVHYAVRLRDSISVGNFRQPPQNGVGNCGVVMGKGVRTHPPDGLLWPWVRVRNAEHGPGAGV